MGSKIRGPCSQLRPFSRPSGRKVFGIGPKTVKNPLLGIFGSGVDFCKNPLLGSFGIGMNFLRVSKNCAAPNKCGGICCSQLGFFFRTKQFFDCFKKLWARNKCGCAFAARPWFFLFLFCRIPRMAIFDSHSPAVRKGFLTRVKSRTKNRNYREFQISSRMEIRDSHDFSSLCAKPEKRAAVASCCWRRIFAARAFSQFCDFSILAISTTFVKIRHDDFRSKTTLVIFQKAHLTRHAKIF